MKKAFNTRIVHLLLSAFAVLLIVFACSKSNNDEETAKPIKTPTHLKEWAPLPVVDTTLTYMSFLTEGVTTATVSLTSATADSPVWVDTNNNGVFDEGTDVRITDPTKPITFTPSSKVFTIYGEVTALTATSNALIAADVRHNTHLTKLNVANNKLTAEALTKLVASLPTATGAAIVLRNAEGDGNDVTNTVREAVAAKGWKPLRLNKEGAEEEDKEAPKPEPEPEPKPEPKPEPQPEPQPEPDREKPIVGTVSITNISYDKATVTWEKATDNKTPAEKLTYQLFWQIDGSAEAPSSTTAQTNFLSHEITALTEEKKL